MFFRGILDDDVGESEAWSLGYIAYCRITGIDANPFPAGSPEHADWRDGYNEAAKDDDDNALDAR